MENASDALKMAAGILVFVAALSLTMLAFSRAKEASSTVMSAREDTKTYYEYVSDEKKYSSYREVGVDSIIPMMYSYYNNFYTLLFYVGLEWDDKTDTFERIEELPIYYTETLDQPTGKRNGDINSKSQLQKSTLTCAGGRRYLWIRY